MKDEIKEKIKAYYVANDIDKILDYITNLQEQLHQASLDIQELTEKDIGCPSWCDKLTNLQEKVEDLRRIFGIWNNRKLIKKFNKEYDKEDKNKNPNRNYVVIYPDAEEVYKRYYDYKSRNEKAIEYINKLLKTDDIPLTDVILTTIKEKLGGDEE